MSKKSKIPKTAITEKGLKKLIKDAVGTDGSRTDWANENGVTPQQVSAFFCGKQGAGLKIPAVLGYRPQTIYLPVDEELISTPNPPRVPAKVRPSSKVDHTKEPIVKKGLKKKDDWEETKKRLKKKNKKNKP